MSARRTNPQSSDVVVVGGGMVGAVTALAIARHRLSVTLVEPRSPRALPDGAEWELRVSALSRASESILRKLNAWKGIPATRICSYEAMDVWDAAGSGRVHFDAADLGETCLGHIIENRRVQWALWEQLENHPDIRIANAIVASVACEGETATAKLDNGDRLEARLVVAADGAASPTREMLGIDVDEARYDQQGIVAVVSPEKPHGKVARQRFLPTGPLALLPLADGSISIVWSASDAEARRLLALDDAAFLEALATASEHVLGEFTATSARAAFPLRRQHAQRYSGTRHVLVGDAAHVVHPLAGQGANLGFMDAAALADVLGEADREGRDIGSTRVLRRYERWRKGDNLATLWTMDGFKQLFSNDDTLLARIRNTGFALFDRISPLKQAAMKKAMGRSGDLPELARE